MTRADIVSALCEYGYYKSQAGEVVDEIIRIISDALARGEKVQLNRFGTFEVKKRRGRRCVDIATGEVHVTEDMLAPVFRPARTLKNAVNGLTEDSREADVRHEDV